MNAFIIMIAAMMSAFVGHWPVIRILKKAGANKIDSAGRWIGYLERALITLFVALNLTTETVFIFATKAAFMAYRLPKDDEPSKQKAKAEYMLIGTLASYLVALIFGLIAREIFSQLNPLPATKP